MTETRIGVLGTGSMGTAVAGLMARSGYRVGVGSRNEEKARAAAGHVSAWAGTYAEVVRQSDVLFWTVAWEHAEGVLGELPSLSHAIFVDCSNPETPDGRHLAIGHSSSGAETIARWRQDARLVKAFNHTYAEVLEREPVFGVERASVLLCGDEPADKAVVSQIAMRCGFDPIDCGPIGNARLLEPAAMLMVQLVREMGSAPGEIAFKLLRRGPTT